MTTKALQESRRVFARHLMFWLGAIYLVVSVHAMTPYTFQLDDIKITLVHLLGPILIVTYLFLLLKKWVDPPRPLVFVPFLLYMAVMLLSALFAAKHARWVGFQMTLFQWALLGPYLAFMVGCSDIDGARRGLKLFMLILLGSTLFGLAHRLGVAGIIYEPLKEAYQNTPASRAGEPSFMLKMSATFASAQNEMMSIILNRDFYGCFLALTIPMAIGVMLLARSIVWQALAVATLPLAGICLVLTNSKDSWAATLISIGLVGFLYMFVAKLRIKHRRQVLLIGGALLFAMLVVAFVTKGMLAQQIKSVGISFGSRDIIWGGALGIWKDFPILGAGPGSYRMYFPIHRSPDYFLYDISHVTISAHNYFLDLLCDTGVLGFITFMSFLGILYWKNFRHVRLHPNRDHRIASMCLLAGLTGFFLNAITSPCPRWAVGAVNLWSTLGMLAGMIQYPVVYRKTGEGSVSRSEGNGSGEDAFSGQYAVISEPSRSLFAGLRPYQTPVTAALLVLCAALGLYSAFWGIQFFNSAHANNKGVTLIGDENRPGPVSQLRVMLQEKREQLGNPNLSAADRQKLEQEVAYFESLFNEKREEAIGHFEKAVRLSPSAVTSLYKLASLYSMGSGMYPQVSDYRKALDTYLKIQQYWPEYSQTQYNLGTVYLGLSQFAQDETEREKNITKALEYFKQAVEMSIEPDINSFYIRILLESANGTKNPIQADEWKKEALRVAERLMRAWDETLGYQAVPRNQRKPNQPAYILRNSVRKSPLQQQQILLNVAEINAVVARAVDDQKALLSSLKRLRELTPGDESVIAGLVRIYRESKDDASLKQLVDEVLAENPLNLRARFWAGALAAEAGNLREAKKQALILKKVDSAYAESEYLLFLLYDGAGNTSQAKNHAASYIQMADNAERRKIAEDYLKKHSATGTIEQITPKD